MPHRHRNRWRWFSAHPFYAVWHCGIEADPWALVTARHHAPLPYSVCSRPYDDMCTGYSYAPRYNRVILLIDLLSLGRVIALYNKLCRSDWKRFLMHVALKYWCILWGFKIIKILRNWPSLVNSLFLVQTSLQSIIVLYWGCVQMDHVHRGFPLLLYE